MGYTSGSQIVVFQVVFQMVRILLKTKYLIFKTFILLISSNFENFQIE